MQNVGPNKRAPTQQNYSLSSVADLNVPAISKKANYSMTQPLHLSTFQKRASTRAVRRPLLGLDMLRYLVATVRPTPRLGTALAKLGADRCKRTVPKVGRCASLTHASAHSGR